MDRKCLLEEVDVFNELGHGAAGVVYEASFRNQEYAFKRLNDTNKGNLLIENNLDSISKFYGDSRFVIPYRLVYNNNEFVGYIMDYVKNFDKLCDLELSYDKKIHILKKARELVDILHNNYKHLHTDINPWNFLYNKELDKVVLIDFDGCINMDNINKKNIDNLNTLAKIYCQYNNVDFGLDIFLFNLLTFSILNNVEFYDVINYIMENNYGCIENKKALEILSDYEDIEYNTLKKEYIIDHI